jgi:HD-like signal output (HDOD) protein
MACSARPAVDRALGLLDRLRPPSPSVDAVLAELSSDRVSFARLEKLIERDGMLTAAFLKRANSALLHPTSDVRSIRQALTLLGTEELLRFMLSLSASCLCPGMSMTPHFSRKLYSRHASATALLAGLIERRLGQTYGGHTAMASLLHDVSKLLVALTLPEEFNRIVEGGTWDEAREQEILGIDHGEFSTIVLKAWKFPAEVTLAVGEHHSKRADGGRPTLSVVIGCADNYTAILAQQPNPELGEFDERVLYGLGLDPIISELVTEFQARIHVTA